MRIRAVIFDVYHTLLEVGPPPVDAGQLWEQLLVESFGHAAADGKRSSLSLTEFGAACEEVIRREHASARAGGISFPEVYWPAVASEVLPELGALSDGDRDKLLFAHARLLHSTSLMPDAAETLRALISMPVEPDPGLADESKVCASNICLGIASNAQPYTLRELDAALGGEGLTPKIFTPELCFWSFENGFSKPDPHVFRQLNARLAASGVRPSQTLMVGDRLDYDIEPARAQGWQTWQLRTGASLDRNGGESVASSGGDWLALRDWLAIG